MTDVAVQNEPDQKVEKTTPAKDSNPAGDVAFNDAITIHADVRLPHLDKGTVRAYAASRVGDVARSLFVMVCEDNLTPRHSKIPNYAVLNNHSIVSLVAHAPVLWPPAKKEKYCLVFENNLGMPVMKNDTRGGLDMKQDVVLTAFVRPIINALLDMRDKDIVHGCIRLSNIFDGGKKELERAILGEPLSIPASYHMSVLYEPIERSMASPAGRGEGVISDDLYSLGVCLAVLLREHDPLEGMSDDEIIQTKIEEGSYAALTGKDRFTGAILELLRGLLHDDPVQRWNLDEIVEWLDGRRLTPKQSFRPAKASRPIVFGGHKYTRPELLAMDLHKNVTEAKQLIEGGEMEQWIQRAIENKPLQVRYEKALQLASDGAKSGSYPDILIARVSMALHPEAPIRYKSIKVMPEGVGTALMDAFVTKRDIQIYHEFFTHYFIMQWIDVQTRSVLDVSGLISRFDGARAYLRQKALGGGLERCIYTLNANAPCLSEKIAAYYVMSPEALMRSYEAMSKNPGKPSLFFDRQTIAFLSVKDRKCIDPYISDISAEEPYKRILGELKVLAVSQRRLQLERFPGIAAWVVENLGPVYQRFHDRELRVEIKKKVEHLKAGGDLPKILALFEDANAYQEDNTGFRRAMKKHYELETEHIDLERDLAEEATFGRDVGKQIAAIVSGVLAAIIIFTTLFMTINGGSAASIF